MSICEVNDLLMIFLCMLHMVSTEESYLMKAIDSTEVNLHVDY
jgi:hypothetical protein